MIWLVILCSWLYLVGCLLMCVWGDEAMGRLKWKDVWVVLSWPLLIPYAFIATFAEEAWFAFIALYIRLTMRTVKRVK